MKTHRFDPISFVSGLVITLLGLAFLIPQTPVDVVDVLTDLGGWFWPVLLLAIGVAVLLPVVLPKDTPTPSIEAEDGTPSEDSDQSG
ncbi:MAG TPA: hypothetical protein VF083_11775 [Acidimicrobiia bacterium]